MGLAKRIAHAHNAAPLPTPTSVLELAVLILVWVARWQMAAMSLLLFVVRMDHARSTLHVGAIRHLIVAPPLWCAME